MIYINDLNQAIKFSRVHHFAGNTNLILVDNSLKKISKHIKHDLKLLTTWLRANSISLNTSKTEILLFRSQSKRNITEHLNFRISGQYIPRKIQFKYLGLTFNERLSWDLYFSQLKKKLNRGIGFLAKIRHITQRHLLKTLYFPLFNSSLTYGYQILGQDQNEEFKKIEKLPEKAITIISFLRLNATVEKQMHEMKILKLKDFFMLQNILFVKDCFSENAPDSFNDKFHSSKLPLNHTTRSTSTYQLKVNNFKTKRYGCKSIVNKCTLDWNNLQKILKQNFQIMKRSDLKTNIKSYFLKQYNDKKD